jgi:quercetin dioxygenase-like cupin family protein
LPAGLFAAPLLAVAAFLASGAASAQTTATPPTSAPVADSPQRMEQKRTDLIGAPGMEVIASTAEYKPGDTIDLHHHHGVEVVYVVQGATVQSPGKPLLTLRSGATLMNLRDVKHGGFKVVGDTSLKLFTVHVVDKGQPLYDAAPAPSASN